MEEYVVDPPPRSLDPEKHNPAVSSSSPAPSSSSSIMKSVMPSRSEPALRPRMLGLSERLDDARDADTAPVGTTGADFFGERPATLLIPLHLRPTRAPSFMRDAAH